MSSQSGSSPFWGRYRALIVFISVFVLSIVSVLSLNFYISAQFEADALDINLAGRQRMLSQRTVKTLLNVQQAQQSGGGIQSALTELNTTFDLFDNTLTAFDVGGQTVGADGSPVTLQAVRVADGRAAVDEATQIWTDYREVIRSLLTSDHTSLQALSQATGLVLEKNEALLEIMNDLTGSLEANGADGNYINLAGRQRMLSQRMAKSLFEIELAQLDNADVNIPLGQLNDTVDLFDSTLRAFAEGGATTDGAGRPVTLAAIDIPQAREYIDQALLIWEPLNREILAVLEGDTTALDGLSDAIAAATANNLDMLRLMNDLTVALEQDASRRSGLLRLIQVAGIALALTMFGIILFYFLRQLRKRDAEVDQAKSETDQILATVNDGLFLMDKDYTIGGQHSQSLIDIFDKQELAGENFMSILRKIVPEKTLNTAEDYIELLYGERVNEALVTDLNPLDEVEVHFESGAGDHRVKYLEFNFKRAHVDGKLSHLLVQVDDISQRVKLANELKESQEKAQQQFDLMLKVLHVEPKQLGAFLNDTEKSLADINEVLRKRSGGPSRNKEKLDQIFRMMHTIKGDASSLDLDAFVDKAHDFEGLLEEMRANKQLEGSDFLPLAIRLDDFMTQIDSLRALIQRLSDLKEVVRQEGEAGIVSQQPDTAESLVDFDLEQPAAEVVETDAENRIDNTLRNLAHRVAAEQGKQIELTVAGQELLPDIYRKPMSDVFTQFVRNSITHGIELPDERQSLGKPTDGQLSLSINTDTDGQISAVFRDDGRGISIERLKQAAVDKNFASAEQLATLNDNQIIGLMFKPGFSTADNVDKNAGRGVGMDVVAATLRDLNGRIKIRYQTGKFCEFQITLPSIQPANDEQEVTGAVAHS